MATVTENSFEEAEKRTTKLMLAIIIIFITISILIVIFAMNSIKDERNQIIHDRTNICNEFCAPSESYYGAGQISQPCTCEDGRILRWSD